MAEGVHVNKTELLEIAVANEPALDQAELSTLNAVPVTVPAPVLSTTVQLWDAFQKALPDAGDVAVPVKEGTKVAPEFIVSEPDVPTRIWSKLVPGVDVEKAASSQL